MQIKKSTVNAGGGIIKITELVDISKDTSKYIILNLYDDMNYFNTTKVGAKIIAGTSTINPSHFYPGTESTSIIFTYKNGVYTNSKYGNLTNIQISNATTNNNVAVVSLSAVNYIDPTFTSLVDMPSVYLNDIRGTEVTASIINQTTVTNTNSLINIAKSFVGKPWSMGGYWTLLDTIASLYGSSLPISSIGYTTTPESNDKWVLKYNGIKPVGDWKSLINPGDIIFMSNTSDYGGGAICVSGNGTNAMVIDNVITGTNIIDSNYIKIAEPHLFNTEDIYNSPSNRVFIYSYNGSLTKAPIITKTVTPTKVVMTETPNINYTIPGKNGDITVSPVADKVFGPGQHITSLGQMSSFYPSKNGVIISGYKEDQVVVSVSNLPDWAKGIGLTPMKDGVYKIAVIGTLKDLSVTDYINLIIDSKLLVDIKDMSWKAGYQSTLSINKGSTDKYYVVCNNKEDISWMKIDQVKGEISGVPPLSEWGADLKLTVYQQENYYAPQYNVDDFTIHITNPINLIGAPTGGSYFSF